jgi:hypothetical protein
VTNDTELTSAVMTFHSLPAHSTSHSAQISRSATIPAPSLLLRAGRKTFLLMRAPSFVSRSFRPFEGSAAKAGSEKDGSVVARKERFGWRLWSVCER